MLGGTAAAREAHLVARRQCSVLDDYDDRDVLIIQKLQHTLELHAGDAENILHVQTYAITT